MFEVEVMIHGFKRIWCRYWNKTVPIELIFEEHLLLYQVLPRIIDLKEKIKFMKSSG